MDIKGIVFVFILGYLNFSQVEGWSKMLVQVRPTGWPNWIKVECWSEWSGTFYSHLRGSGATMHPKDLSWDYNPNTTEATNTRFYCEAMRHDYKTIHKFPVFGNGVPKESSTWLVDMEGKRRIRENNIDKNDYWEKWL